MPFGVHNFTGPGIVLTQTDIHVPDKYPYPSHQPGFRAIPGTHTQGKRKKSVCTMGKLHSVKILPHNSLDCFRSGGQRYNKIQVIPISSAYNFSQGPGFGPNTFPALPNPSLVFPPRILLLLFCQLNHLSLLHLQLERTFQLSFRLLR